MSLTGALQVGRSVLMAAQAGIEVSGNNLANLATQGYHRQTLQLAPSGDGNASGTPIGRGAQVQTITRVVDDALEARIRDALSQESGSRQISDVLEQIQSIEGELGESNVSTQLGDFFNSISNLANSPLDAAARSQVIQQGQTLASYLQTLRTNLVNLRAQVDASTNQSIDSVNDLLARISDVSQQLTASQASGGSPALEDQRDQLLQELAGYLPISVVNQTDGTLDIHVGSTPIMLANLSRGVVLQTSTVDGVQVTQVAVKADGTPLDVSQGRLGALQDSRNGDVQNAIDALDGFAQQLIYQINRVYSQGQGAKGYTSITGTTRVTDPAAALNSAATEIPFAITNGSIQLNVTQLSTGQTLSTTVAVSLNGVAGDTTLTSLAAAINAANPSLSATVTTDGRLSIATVGGDYALTFGSDTSGALAALGINTFFSGSSARDMAVNATLVANPSFFAAGRNNIPGDNTNALALAGLQNQALSDLGGMSLSELWHQHVSDYAVRLGRANSQNTTDSAVVNALQSQQQSISGVNADEETINLMSYQRAYQAGARLLSVINQMMDSLLNAT